MVEQHFAQNTQYLAVQALKNLPEFSVDLGCVIWTEWHLDQGSINTMPSVPEWLWMICDFRWVSEVYRIAERISVKHPLKYQLQFPQLSEQHSQTPPCIYNLPMMWFLLTSRLQFCNTEGETEKERGVTDRQTKTTLSSFQSLPCSDSNDFSSLRLELSAAGHWASNVNRKGRDSDAMCWALRAFTLPWLWAPWPKQIRNRSTWSTGGFYRFQFTKQ